MTVDDLRPVLTRCLRAAVPDRVRPASRRRLMPYSELARERPAWMKVRAPSGNTRFAELQGIMRDGGLHTVCEEARCPNIGECWGRGTATFQIMGDVCTRACRYCAVTSGRPEGAPEPLEPLRVATAVRKMGLRHVVVTSVDRDDLPDRGAGHFAATIRAIRRRAPECGVEVLVPDFLGFREEALRTVLAARAGRVQPQHRDGRALLPAGAAPRRLPQGAGPARPGQGRVGRAVSGCAAAADQERRSSWAWARPTRTWPRSCAISATTASTWSRSASTCSRATGTCRSTAG